MPKYLIVHEVTVDAIIDEPDDLTIDEVESMELVGLYRAPTIFCHCPMGKRNSSFTRGQKYYWWVHTDCGKPTVGWGKNPGAIVGAGYDKNKDLEEQRKREIASQETLESQSDYVI